MNKHLQGKRIHKKILQQKIHIRLKSNRNAYKNKK